MTRRGTHRCLGRAGGGGRVRRLFRDQDGSALIEFTLLAPFLLTLALGMTELGRFLYQYQMVI